MKDLKKHLQVSDQLDLLISRGVLVNDRTLAERWLSNANYYRISGYLYRYRTQNGSYQPGTSLEQIHALYDFDRKLTRILMFALEDIEETLKTRISYTSDFGLPVRTADLSAALCLSRSERIFKISITLFKGCQ